MKHSHYFKDVSHLKYIDVYRVIDLWEIKDPCIQHALKKVLSGGKRGAKDEARDIQEAIDSLERWKAMREEDKCKAATRAHVDTHGDGWFLASDYKAFVFPQICYDLKFADGKIMSNVYGDRMRGLCDVQYVRPHQGI